MKKVEIETPKFENVQVGVTKETKWETSDGLQHGDEDSAEYHEFYNIKLKRRGINLPVDSVELFDFTCKEDLDKYENESMYRSSDRLIKYDKDIMEFPKTFVMYEINDPDWESTDSDDDSYNYYDQPDTHIYLVTLDDYKKLLIDAVNKIV